MFLVTNTNVSNFLLRLGPTKWVQHQVRFALRVKNRIEYGHFVIFYHFRLIRIDSGWVHFKSNLEPIYTSTLNVLQIQMSSDAMAWGEL